MTGPTRGASVHVMGDAHVYNNHVTALREQLTRARLPAAASCPLRQWDRP